MSSRLREGRSKHLATGRLHGRRIAPIPACLSYDSGALWCKTFHLAGGEVGRMGLSLQGRLRERRVHRTIARGDTRGPEVRSDPRLRLHPLQASRLVESSSAAAHQNRRRPPGMEVERVFSEPRRAEDLMQDPWVSQMWARCQPPRAHRIPEAATWRRRYLSSPGYTPVVAESADE